MTAPMPKPPGAHSANVLSGSEQVLDDRGDDRGERGADDHANGHVQDVPAHGEFLEFLKELFYDGFLLYKLYNICLTK